MERFQKIKAGRRKLDVTAICRFCGLENDEKYNILELNEDGVEFSSKVSSMMSIKVHRQDKMPQNVCFICMDKINDFYEFRLMALNTDKQTREALGLPLVEMEQKPQPRPQVRFNQFENLSPVVKLVDLKYSIQDQILIQKALGRYAETRIKKEPNIPIKRTAQPSCTVTSQQPQPPNKKARKDISCNICSDANFSYSNDLQDHQMKEHLPLVSKYACGSCRETFEQLSDFKNHENMHSRTKLPYTCFICLSPYGRLRDFQKHMTNYNCKEKEKLIVTVEDIKCFQCKKKFLTQNLFEWHGCFLKTRGTCSKCGQFFQKKKMLLKHYVLCEGRFVTPEAARDPNNIKSEMMSPSSRGSVVKITSTGVRKKTVPPRRMTTIKSEKEINLANVTEQPNVDEDEDDEYANYEEDITYDNFGSDEDDDESSGPNVTNLMPVVELQEQQQGPQISPQRIIDIKAEKTTEQSAIKEHTIGANNNSSIDPQIIRNIKLEQVSKQTVVGANKITQQQLSLRIKAERGANEQPVVQVLNPLAIGNSTTTNETRKKVFKLPQELAAKIKQEKMNTEYGDSMRDEAEPDPDEEEQMTASDTPSSNIKIEKIDSEYAGEMQQKKALSNTKQLINPMALAMMREKNNTTSAAAVTTNGSESNSLVISAVMSVNSSTNGQTEPQNSHENESTIEEKNESNNEKVKESVASSFQELNPVMVEIPAEFSKVSQQYISPAVNEMSSNVSMENNEVATTSVIEETTTTIPEINTNDDDELNQLLENLEKYGGDDDAVVGVDLNVSNNLQDSDLQDLLKFD
ncbi:hypothetical protein PVAND_001331 [Polypedilum vanderplanki]|uniref:Zinc finger protein n=1 Tax=Polypedilum vanderplanki TaxID=319348 RepID=A0A9J6BN30_POLVA|nr:hypothetical protein PVAND_001331 [Polypedilum vanderplanki]